MKVALFAYAWPYPGQSPVSNPGITTVMWNLAKALSRMVDVTILASSPNDEGEEHEFGRVNVVPIPHFWRLGAFQLNQLDFARAVDRQWSKRLSDFDVLHDIGSLVPLVSKEFSERGIATFHHHETPQTLRDLFQSVPVPLPLKRERKVPTIVAVSEFAKQQLVSLLGVRHRSIHVIPDGVDHAIFHRQMVTREAENGPRILFVGSLSLRKDPMTLLEAVRILLRRGVPLNVLCIGSGPEEKRLRKYAQDNGLGQHVTFARHVNTATLATEYNRSDLVVVPSRLEGFGMVALESMACGTPVVHSRIRPLTDVVGDAGTSFQPGSAVDLAGCIQQLLQQDDLRKELGQRGVARSQAYDWSAIAEKHLRVYQSAAAG